MLVARDLISKISDRNESKAGSRSRRYDSDRTSPDEPFEMYRNVRVSCVVPRSYPSAMLFDIETPARSSWSFKP